MTTKIIGAICLLSLVSRAQVEIKKTLPDFNKIEISANTTVYLKKSATPFISMEQQDTITPGVRFDVVEGKLIVQDKKNVDLPVKVTIGYTTLNEIEAHSAATIKSSETITSTDFSFNISGAAKCKLDISVNNLSIVESGAASLSLSGACNKVEAIISGAASLKAEGLVSENGDINTSGASTARVNVKNKLVGNNSGASTLKYAGDPKEVQLNQSGAATIKRIDYTVTGNFDTTGVTKSHKDSTRRYTINGRYEIVIHESFKNDTNAYYYKRKHDGRIRKQNWCGVDLFQNGLLTPNNDVTLASNYDYMSPDYGLRNLGWNLNMFEKDFRFAKGHMQFVTGLGFSFNSFALKNKTTLNADSSYTTFSYNPSAEYRKNKLRESFVTVPLLLELNTSRRDSRNFHIAFGVIGGLKLGSSTKQIFTVNTHTFETKRKDDYNLFPFKLDATVRVGYGAFTMFATYSLTPLFEYGKGPELYPFTVGIRIVPFD